MFCGKCGSEIKNGVSFCPNCGEKLVSNYIVKENQKSKNSNNLIKFAIPVVLIIVTVAIVSLVLIHNNTGYKKTIDKFYTAVEKQDVNMMKSTLAQYWIDYQIADYDTDEYLNDDLNDIIEDVIDDFDCGDNVGIVSCTITNERKASKEELESLKDNIYDWYAYYVYDKDKFDSSIKAAYVVNVRVKVKGDDGANMVTSNMLVIKENGKWKITIGYLDNSFYSNN